MQEALHIDLTKVAAELAKWPGDVNVLAKNAAFPDEVRSVEINGFGAHLFGLNCASLVHFCIPILGTKATHKCMGYAWYSDTSVPVHNLPDVSVISRADEWPIEQRFIEREPLNYLIRSLTGKATIAADEITWPSASSHVDWLEKAFREMCKDQAVKYGVLDEIAGWLCHFIEDILIPHHVHGWLLRGHAELEAKLTSVWRKLRFAGMTPTLSKGFKTNVGSLRRYAEGVAINTFDNTPIKPTDEGCKDILNQGIIAAVTTLRTLARIREGK